MSYIIITNLLFNLIFMVMSSQSGSYCACCLTVATNCFLEQFIVINMEKIMSLERSSSDMSMNSLRSDLAVVLGGQTFYIGPIFVYSSKILHMNIYHIF